MYPDFVGERLNRFQIPTLTVLEMTLYKFEEEENEEDCEDCDCEDCEDEE